MFELQKPKLHRTVKGTDKHNRYNVFSLWWDSESFDKELGLKYPETLQLLAQQTARQQLQKIGIIMTSRAMRIWMKP